MAQAERNTTQEVLDRVTDLVAHILDVPVVCLSLINGERQLLTSSSGLAAPIALLLSHSFARHVSAQREPVVVGDGRADPLVANNPAVMDGMVTAFAGTPLVMDDGRAIGTLCAMDYKPRTWTEGNLRLLQELPGFILRAILNQGQRF
jgi:GAF domain-containing protein